MSRQTLAIFGYVFFFPLVYLCLLGCAYVLPLYLILPLYAAWYIYDRNTPSTGGRHLPLLRRLLLWKWFAEYFPIRLHKTQDLDPSKNYLFCLHPHGVFLGGGACNFISDATGFGRLFPQINVQLVAMSCNFYIPFHREIAMALGLTPPSAQSIAYNLTRKGPGHSVVLVTGGVKEIPLSARDEYKLFINSRKGFIRVALRSGSQVVPVFSFGETKLFHYGRIDSDVSLFYRLCIRLLGENAQHFKNFSFRGNPILPSCIPLRQEINTVVGLPITFEPMAENLSKEESEAHVDACHKKYLDALRKLYDENKNKYGDAHTPLIFC